MIHTGFVRKSINMLYWRWCKFCNSLIETYLNNCSQDETEFMSRIRNDGLNMLQFFFYINMYMA